MSLVCSIFYNRHLISHENSESSSVNCLHHYTKYLTPQWKNDRCMTSKVQAGKIPGSTETDSRVNPDRFSGQPGQIFGSTGTDYQIAIRYIV